MPEICVGSQKDRNGCSCTLFIPKKSKGNKCKTCGHRQSSHSNTPTTPPRDANTNVAVIKQRDRGEYVHRLFKSFEASAVHENARKETLEGFRPTSPPFPALSSKKGKGRQVPNRAVSRTASPVKFGRIVFFPCGDQNIGRFKFPTINSVALQPWVNAGLAVEANDSGLIFQLDWGSKQFNAFLRRLFPILFAYFDTITPGFKLIPDEPDTIGMKKIEYSLPYVLLQKNRKNYFIVDDTHPVATKYKTYLSGDTTSAGFRAKSIFLVTKDSIPQEALDGWFNPSTAPTIPIAPLKLTTVENAGKKRRRADSISVSSDSSGASIEDSDYVADEETEIGTDDDIKIVEKPPRKRARVLSPPIPEFVQGSSSTSQGQDVDGLARQLQQSASFEETSHAVWQSDGEDLWKF